MNHAGNAVRTAAEGLTEMCSVHAGQTQFGVPITHVLEILGRQTAKPVPLAPPWIGGLVHYRGEVLTAVSLRQLLGMPPQAGSSEDILVFEGADGYFGLVVDAVGEVLTVSPATFEANPSTLEDRHKALFVGTCKLKDKLLVLLDPALLDPERLNAEAGVPGPRS